MRSRPLNALFLLCVICFAGTHVTYSQGRKNIAFMSKVDTTYSVSCKIQLTNADNDKKINLNEQQSLSWDPAKCYSISLEPTDGFHFNRTIYCDEYPRKVYLEADGKFLYYLRQIARIKDSAKNSRTGAAGKPRVGQSGNAAAKDVGGNKN